MSLLSPKFTLHNLLQPNQLQVAIGVDSIVTALFQRNKVVSKQHIAYTQQAGESAAQSISIQLDTILFSMQLKPTFQLEIVLASDFVRYMALPAHQLAMSKDEKIAYAIAAYNEVYGAVADGWHIKLNDAAPNQSIIAAALDKQLLEAITQIALKHRLKLISLQPYVVIAFNGLVNQINQSAQYLAIVESRRLLLLKLQYGQCQNVRSFALENDWQVTLKKLISRESLINEQVKMSNLNNSNKNEISEILVYAPMQKNIVLTEIEGWRIKHIGHFAAGNTLNAKLPIFEAAI